jgi:hypothetical protein
VPLVPLVPFVPAGPAGPATEMPWLCQVAPFHFQVMLPTVKVSSTAGLFGKSMAGMVSIVPYSAGVCTSFQLVLASSQV